MKLILFACGLILAVAAGAGAAWAQNYPWCANYAGGRGGGGMNCGFTTFEQCLATVRGIGGFCERNTPYQPPAGPHPHMHARLRHHMKVRH